jgi:hypothetical protein
MAHPNPRPWNRNSVGKKTKPSGAEDDLVGAGGAAQGRVCVQGCLAAALVVAQAQYKRTGPVDRVSASSRVASARRVLASSRQRSSSAAPKRRRAASGVAQQRRSGDEQELPKQRRAVCRQPASGAAQQRRSGDE